MATVVFLGPSMSHEAARQILAADYRPPIRRGDLSQVMATRPRRIAIIDGEFHQSLSVSVVEIRDVLGAGVQVWGASSMGALRAAECGPLGMRGMGWVYEAYSTGAIESDAEVALLFAEATGTALTLPLVCLRYIVEVAQERGLISKLAGRDMIRLGQAVHYTERTFDSLIRQAPPDLSASVSLLRDMARREGERVDPKHLDARSLLLYLRASEDHGRGES